jgi:hypothetical protein
MSATFRVTDSDMSAQYDKVSMEVYHGYKVYGLDAPLKMCPDDKCELVDGHMHISFSDGTKRVLKAKSTEEFKAQYASQNMKLRVVRQKHAKKALMLSRTIERAVKALVKVEEELHKDSVAIAGDLYQNNHHVSFEPNGSNDSQVDCDGFITTPDFASVLKMATETISLLEPVVTAAEPLDLPYARSEF